MKARSLFSSDQHDPRGIWQGLTTPDGLTVEGCELDGFHVRRDGIVLASFYRAPEGENPLAALAAYREIERRRPMTTTD